MPDATATESDVAWCKRQSVAVGVAFLVALSAVFLIYAVPFIYLETLADDRIEKWKPALEPVAMPGSDFYKCADVDPPALRPAAPAKGAVSSATPCREFLPAEVVFVMSSQTTLLKFGPVQMSMVIDLLRWQYFASLAALIAGALTTTALLAVSFQGWANSALWTKVFFIICSVSAALWFAVPQMYKYEDNIAAALKRYNTAFLALQQIGVVRATGRNADGSWVVPSTFVSALSARVAEANGFLVVIDQSKAALQKIEAPKSN